MALAKEKHNFAETLSLLNQGGQKLVKKLHAYTLSLGCAVTVSALGKKAHNWKCEYALNKNTLLILRITDGQWSVRCKLFHLPEYNQALEQCGSHCIENLLANAKNCGMHGGSCKGPVLFSVDGNNYSQCRHSFLWKNIIEEDIDGITHLLRCESEFYVKN